jgi:uncharacterized membrane protein YvbJ
MFCKNCGKEIKEGASFCSNCGMKIGAGGAGISQVPELKDAPKNTAKIKRSKTRNAPKKIWIPVILVICLVAGYFGYQKVVGYVIAAQIDQTIQL